MSWEHKCDEDFLIVWRVKFHSANHLKLWVAKYTLKWKNSKGGKYLSDYLMMVCIWAWDFHEQNERFEKPEDFINSEWMLSGWFQFRWAPPCWTELPHWWAWRGIPSPLCWRFRERDSLWRPALWDSFHCLSWIAAWCSIPSLCACTSRWALSYYGKGLLTSTSYCTECTNMNAYWR